MDVNSIEGDQLINILDSNTPYEGIYLRNVGFHNEGIYLENLEVNDEILFSDKYIVNQRVFFRNVTFKTGVSRDGFIMGFGSGPIMLE